MGRNVSRKKERRSYEVREDEEGNKYRYERYVCSHSVPNGTGGGVGYPSFYKHVVPNGTCAVVGKKDSINPEAG
jgi:hypothetical protein